MAKRLGIIPHLFAQPLFYGLKNLEESPFDIVEESALQLAIKLRLKELDGAFLSPIDYARDYSKYRIVPDVAAISVGESNSVLLCFKENTRQIKTLAFEPSSSSEIVLASIILAEKYNIKTQLIPVAASIDQAMMQADAYLVPQESLTTGDTAHRIKERTLKIDLVDEWFDITELPFVHGFWAARENALTPDEMKFLIECGKHGTDNLEKIMESNLSEQLIHFRYNLDEEAKISLTEFFRMAYYHGILQDIPEVKFFSQNP
ncbi:MAG: hypothetical protein QME52_06370 [Bacteroidota bacterium]|nr:hypothetical protein [Bacteroidota bacterium]